MKRKSVRARAARLGTNLDQVAFTLNELLSKQEPTRLNSSWIQRHAPACYRFIRKWIRNEIGAVDWDHVTRELSHPINLLELPPGYLMRVINLA
ncbi:MAG TPA: hypothetical protein VE398_09530 [Acidobacteriota bacterium]|nr:hypothetical protein [Acidobacteriota bacterium]